MTDTHRRYTGDYVVLARNLKDAWAAARIHRLGVTDWLHPRTVEQARALTGGVVVEAPAFRERVDYEEFLAATGHLPRFEQADVGA